MIFVVIGAVLLALAPVPPIAQRIADITAAQKTPRDGPVAIWWGKIRERFQHAPSGDPLAAAADIELFAACLSSGLSTYHAARAVAQVADTDTADYWQRTVALLGVGASNQGAWEPLREHPHLAELATLVVMSGQSGAAIAAGCSRHTRALRAEASAHATAAAERAGVFIALPLAVCFLPAFIVLGLVPVVIGLGMQIL
ncbi:type II secretion system F family protein [Corynebacterium camporealensis]|uniref:type II secretion system F family protein n=1 Tax=Corynebacterium camporealensis TaxID=161896 RepID=UPI0034CDCC00